MGVICLPCGDPGLVEVETALKICGVYGLSKSSCGDLRAFSFTHNFFWPHTSPVPFWMLLKLGLAELCIAVAPAVQQFHVAWKKHFLSSVFIRSGSGPQSFVLWSILRRAEGSGNYNRREWGLINHRDLTKDVCLCWSHSVAQICKTSQAHETRETLYACQNTPNKIPPAYCLPSQQTMRCKICCFITEVNKSEMIHILM